MADREKLSRRSFVMALAGASLLSWRSTPANAYSPFEPFSFAYVTDVHLASGGTDSYKLVHESQLFLQQLVKELNQRKLDFVIFGGDQVEQPGKDQANWQLFLDIAQGLNAPWSFILGETDISGPLPVDKVKTYGPDWKGRGMDTDTSYWSYNPAQLANVHLIGLDTSLPNTTTGGVSQKQMDWLKKDLEANKRSYTIVFCHHPLLPPPPYDGGPPWEEYVIPDGASVREILGNYPNVKLVVSGHLHVSKVQQEKDVWHVSSPSLTVYPCAYRIFRVAPDMVTMETHSIDFPALVKKARKELQNSNLASRYGKEDDFVDLCEGGREDRDAMLPMTAGKSIQPYKPKKEKKEEIVEEKPEKKERRHGKSKEEPAPIPSAQPQPSNTTPAPASKTDEPVLDLEKELMKSAPGGVLQGDDGLSSGPKEKQPDKR
jgi:hypothetical protein